MVELITIDVQNEPDILLARKRLRLCAEALGLPEVTKTGLTNSFYLILENIRSNAAEIHLAFLLNDTEIVPKLVIEIKVRPGETSYFAKPALRPEVFWERIHAEPGPDRTARIVLEKSLLPEMRDVASEKLKELSPRLKELSNVNFAQDIKEQGQETERLLDLLAEKDEEVNRLTRELEDTNRGVLALYAEIEERAAYLKRAGEFKNVTISNLSHEFRSPLSSIIGLSQILLDRMDGELTPPQEEQIQLLQKSASSLLELVNDLLDMSRIEAGKISVKSSEFEVRSVFSTLRGMVRSLVQNSVAFIIEEPKGIPPLCTDEGKLSQILRNLVSNALKFTKHGEIRVRVRLTEGDKVVFSVSDTGIGIAPEDQERIFQEFVQLDNPINRAAKGTGLGLSLSRRLAGLLGGDITVESRLGQGSTFSVTIPRKLPQEIKNTV